MQNFQGIISYEQEHLGINVPNVSFWQMWANLPEIALHKKWSFPLKISSVNVTKSPENRGFGHIYWRHPEWKTSFSVQCYRFGHIYWWNVNWISICVHWRWNSETYQRFQITAYQDNCRWKTAKRITKLNWSPIKKEKKVHLFNLKGS